MTTIPTQPPPPPPPPVNALRSLPVVTVPDPPTALANLAPGTTIEGTVVADAGKTTVQLQTVLGTVQILTTLPLDKGAQLTLILQNLSQPLQLAVAAVDGKVPSVAQYGTAQTTTAATAGDTPPATTVNDAPLAVLRDLVGTPLTATLLRPSVPVAPLFYRPGQVTPATSTPIAGIAGRPMPAPHTPFPAVGTRGPTDIPVPTSTPVGTASPLAARLLAIPPGTQLTVRVIAVNPTPTDPAAVPGGTPANPPMPAALPLADQTMTAVVTGATTAGRPILHTPVGTITLATPTPLPRGAEVVLEVRSEPLLAEPADGPPPPPRPFALMQARTWPTLAEAYQALQSAAPAHAQQTAPPLLPQANPRLAADLLFFLSALRGGDVSGWLSDDNVRVLRRDRPELLNRLGDEFRQIATMAREPLANNWRIALVPFFTGSQVDQIRLYLRPCGGGDAEIDGTPQGTRFIVDVDLTRLGRMQLDGLVRDDRKRFDLIVRTEEPLPAGMQNDIRAIFEDGSALTGVAGGLTFRSAPANFVNVTPSAKTADGPGLLA